MRTLSSTRGFGLLEALLAMAITLGAGALTFWVFASAQTSAQAHRTVEQLNVLATNLSTVYGPAHSYANVSIGAMVKAGLAPSSLVVSRSAGIARDEWGGTTNIYPYGGDATRMDQRCVQPNSCYAIHFNLVPKSVCAKIISALPNAFIGLQVNNQFLHPTNGEIDMSDVASYCDKQDGSDTVYLIFFGR